MNLKYGDQVIVNVNQDGSILILKQDGTDCRIDKNSNGEYYVAMTGHTPKNMLDMFIQQMRQSYRVKFIQEISNDSINKEGELDRRMSLYEKGNYTF